MNVKLPDDMPFLMLFQICQDNGMKIKGGLGGAIELRPTTGWDEAVAEHKTRRERRASRKLTARFNHLFMEDGTLL